MINFIDVPFRFSSRIDFWKRWLVKVAKGYESKVSRLNYQFLNDEKIQEANLKYLNHDYPTDIITFGYQEGSRVSADILLGYQTIETNSKDFGVPEVDELDRVIVHGLLHLIGFDDHSEDEKSKMREAEDKCLILRAEISEEN